jgi:hypothetical protein
MDELDLLTEHINFATNSKNNLELSAIEIQHVLLY